MPKRKSVSAERLRKTFINDYTPADFEALAERRFETAVVSRIMREYEGGRQLMTELVHEARQSNQYVTFADFWSRLGAETGFPVYLFVRRLRRVREDMTLNRLVDKFESCQVFKALDEQLENVPGDAAVKPGLAFFCPYLRDKSSRTSQGGTLVLHGWQHDSDKPGFCLQYRTGSGRLWLIEPLGRLLENCREAGVL